MSVEALVLSAVVDEGASALRTLYANGVTPADFPVYDAEIEWIESRVSAKKPLNRRIFRQQFPDFDWAVPTGSIPDLAAELKEERAFDDMQRLIVSASEQLDRGNAVELAGKLREHLSVITRAHAPMSDVVAEDWQDHIRDMKEAMAAARRGKPMGILSEFPHFDHHVGGFLPGQTTMVLGRTGEGKSFKTKMFALHAKLAGAKVGIFTPELSKHEVRCRLHTLASARPEIKEALGLKHSFRNRALLHRHGFSIKSYERFCRYFDEELPGRIHILSGTYRKEQMTVGFIEDRLVDLGLDLVIIDPIYLLKPVRRYRDNPFAEVGSIAEAIESLAETYNIPVVMTNQAHRQGSQKDDAPHKDKSYGSDVPAQLADIVIGVKHLSGDNRMLVRCTKNRFGEEFRYEMDFFANTGVWRVTTPIKGDYYNGHDASADREEVRQAIQGAVKGMATKKEVSE